MKNPGKFYDKNGKKESPRRRQKKVEDDEIEL